MIFSKVVPCVFAVSLSIWTLIYGEHGKKKAECLTDALAGTGTGAPPAQPGH